MRDKESDKKFLKSKAYKDWLRKHPNTIPNGYKNSAEYKKFMKKEKEK